MIGWIHSHTQNTIYIFRKQTTDLLQYQKAVAKLCSHWLERAGVRNLILHLNHAAINWKSFRCIILINTSVYTLRTWYWNSYIILTMNTTIEFIVRSRFQLNKWQYMRTKHHHYELKNKCKRLWTENITFKY